VRTGSARSRARRRGAGHGWCVPQLCHHHPGRYSAFTRMPLGGDDPEYTAATRGAAAPVIAVLALTASAGDEASMRARVLVGAARLRVAAR